MTADSLRQLLRKLPIYEVVGRRLRRRRQQSAVRAWEAGGRIGTTPHGVKQRVIEGLARRFDTRILVETGTFHGEMVEFARGIFDRVYSIELSEELHRLALEKFKRARNVELLQGDSSQRLGELVQRLDQPALFWLDGHYSAGDTARGDTDTPIRAELDHVLGSPVRGHVILIDDAACFGRDRDYPTIDELRRFIGERRQDLTVSVEDDMISVVPSR